MTKLPWYHKLPVIFTTDGSGWSQNNKYWGVIMSKVRKIKEKASQDSKVIHTYVEKQLEINVSDAQLQKEP